VNLHHNCITTPKKITLFIYKNIFLGINRKKKEQNAEQKAKQIRDTSCAASNALGAAQEGLPL
jgi:hypothetical protein